MLNTKKLFLRFFIALSFVLILLLSCYAYGTKVKALYFRIDGSINPAQKELLEEVLNRAKRGNFDFIIMGLDTPGGLGKTTREMVKLILNSSIPVVCWVSPKGARAASAGIFLVAASTVAVMSPETNIGAATPIAIGGKEIPSTLAKKIQNDFLSLIRALARSRGRNVDWYEKAITEAVSITAEEAVMQRVVDFLAEDLKDLLEQLGKRGIQVDTKRLFFKPQEVYVAKYKPSFRYKFLLWLLDPQIAYLLLLGGMAGMFFELTNPGHIFPGVFGGICMVLALYAMAVLPVNITGILLFILAGILFLLELAITSYGLLSVAGAICLFLGSLLLFRFEYGFVGLPLKLILPTVLGVSFFIFLGLYIVSKAQLRPKQTGAEAMIGQLGEVIFWKGDQGKIKVRGEIWNAELKQSEPISVGDRVEVVGIKGLRLVVKKK